MPIGNYFILSIKFILEEQSMEYCCSVINSIQHIFATVSKTIFQYVQKYLFSLTMGITLTVYR